MLRLTNQEFFIDVFLRLDRQIQANGFSCYDPTDVLSHPFFLFFSRPGLPTYLGRPFRLWEWYAPWFWRRLLGIKPATVPTGFFHVGLAHLQCEGLDILPVKTRTDEICRQALENSLPGPYCAWAHPYSVHAYGWRRPGMRRQGVPPSCAHHTARLGLFLLEAGLAHDRPDFLDAAGSAASALIEYHRWHCYDDETATMSYYPDSDDEVINTGAEAALLFASLPSEYQNARHLDLARRLLRMVLAEQREDGLWDYVTRRHVESKGPAGGPDNHHNAMILTVLAKVVDMPGLGSPQIRSDLHSSLEKGMEAYLDTYLDCSGRCRALPGRSRQGGLDAYAEGSRAMLAAVRTLHCSAQSLVHRLSSLLPALLANAIQIFYDPGTSEVCSYRRFGKTYSTGSIRCGSGLLMEMISSILLWSTQHTWENIDKEQAK